jgi:hypothetical protein
VLSTLVLAKVGGSVAYMMRDKDVTGKGGELFGHMRLAAELGAMVTCTHRTQSGHQPHSSKHCKPWPVLWEYALQLAIGGYVVLAGSQSSLPCNLKYYLPW